MTELSNLSGGAFGSASLLPMEEDGEIIEDGQSSDTLFNREDSNNNGYEHTAQVPPPYNSSSMQSSNSSLQFPLTAPPSEKIPCSICSLKVSIYRCPACDITTCSCQCVKQHKQATGCSGKRNRAKFFSKSEFNNNNLRSDFHFLEDTLQLRTSAQRTANSLGGFNNKPGIKSHTENADTIEEVMNSHQHSRSTSQSAAKLVKGAKEHGVELALMPHGMTKRKINTSRYHKKEDKIYWKVHINFILSEHFNVSSILNFDLSGLSQQGNIIGVTSEVKKEVDEDSLMGDIVDSFLETTSANLANRHHLRGLRNHRQLLSCFIQHIPSPSLNPLFVKLSMDETLRSCLNRKKLIEFPTFIVCVQSQSLRLNLMIREIEDTSAAVTEATSDTSGGSILSPSGSGKDALLSPNRKREFEEITTSTKKIRLKENKQYSFEKSSMDSSDFSSVTSFLTNSNYLVEDDDMMVEVDEMTAENTLVDEESFIKQLLDLENADIAILQNIITTLEEK